MKTLVKITAIVVLPLLILVTQVAVGQVEWATEEGKQWQEYYDVDYGFAVDFPIDWQVQTMWHVPEAEQQAISKRVSFFGPRTEIMVDIWKQPKENVVAWADYLTQYTRPDFDAVINGSVSGFPAVVFIDENEQASDIPMTVFSDKSHTYLVRYIASDGGRAMDIYLHLLESFKSVSVSNAYSDFYFPPEIQERMIQNAWIIESDSCCGVSDPGNPFPCDNGNCVWWVYYKKGYVPMTGDAWKWGWDVYYGLYPGWYLVENPSVGAIAWWDKNTCWSGNYGHVAYVYGKSGSDTWINASEMTWQGTPCSEEPRNRTIYIPSCEEPTGYLRQ